MELRVFSSSKAILHARANARVMMVAQQLEGRRSWLKGGGLSLEPTPMNIDLLKKQLGVEVVQDSSDDFDLKPLRRTTYLPRTPPMPHQAQALEKLRGIEHSALFMEQGTGKSWVAITRAGELWAEGKISGCLVVTKAGVSRQWAEQQVPEHFGGDFVAAAWPKVLPAQRALGLEFFSINYESILSEKGRGRAAVNDFVERHRGLVLMVADESHRIKNDQTKSWSACKDIGDRCRLRMILTGTPIASNLEDEWCQLKFLDERILKMRYKSSFRNEFCVMGGFSGKQVVGARNLDRFQEMTAPYCFRATKKSIGLLPKRYNRVEFSLTKLQSETISDLKLALREQVQEIMSSGREFHISEIASSLYQIQQISNGFLYEGEGQSKKVHRLFGDPRKNPRLSELGRIIDIIDGPVIVWARYRQDIEDIMEWSRKTSLEGGAVSYYGGTSAKDKQAAISDFLEGRARVFVSNVASAGTGLNLHVGGCQNAIYYSNSDDPILRWQSEDRIDRIGMSGSSQFWDLIAKNSLDKGILRRHNLKKSFSSLVLKDILDMSEEEEASE